MWILLGESRNILSTIKFSIFIPYFYKDVSVHPLSKNLEKSCWITFSITFSSTGEELHRSFVCPCMKLLFPLTGKGQISNLLLIPNNILIVMSRICCRHHPFIATTDDRHNLLVPNKELLSVMCLGIINGRECSELLSRRHQVG